MESSLDKNSPFFLDFFPFKIRFGTILQGKFTEIPYEFRIYPQIIPT